MIIDCHGHYTTAPKALEDGATGRSKESTILRLRRKSPS